MLLDALQPANELDLTLPNRVPFVQIRFEDYILGAQG